MSHKSVRLYLVFAVFVAAFSAAPYAWGGNPLLPGIKGDDDRTIVESLRYPWSAIGRLNNSIGGFCTGTMVGERIVLTAAHCLWNNRTQRFLPPDSLHFVAGYRRGEYLRHSKAIEISVAERYQPANHANLDNTVNDWALITLAEDVGKETGFLGITDINKLERNGAVFLRAGYSRDKAHVLSVHRGCRVIGFRQGESLIAHDCDAAPGDSGSPILFFDGAAYSIAAIHVATTKGGKETMGLAAPASAFMKAINRLMAQ